MEDKELQALLSKKGKPSLLRVPFYLLGYWWLLQGTGLSAAAQPQPLSRAHSLKRLHVLRNTEAQRER